MSAAVVAAEIGRRERDLPQPHPAPPQSSHIAANRMNVSASPRWIVPDTVASGF